MQATSAPAGICLASVAYSASTANAARRISAAKSGISARQSAAQLANGRALGQFHFERIAAGGLPGRGKQSHAHVHVTINSCPGVVSSPAISGIRP